VNKLLIGLILIAGIAIADDTPIIVDETCSYNETTGNWSCKSE
jgi:hypothetical protein